MSRKRTREEDDEVIEKTEEEKATNDDDTQEDAGSREEETDEEPKKKSPRLGSAEEKEEAPEKEVDTTEKEESKVEETASKETKAHVFGSGLTFGSALKSSSNIFSSDNKENQDTNSADSKPTPVFGSGFAFGSSSFASAISTEKSTEEGGEEKQKNIFDTIENNDEEKGKPTNGNEKADQENPNNDDNNNNSKDNDNDSNNDTPEASKETYAKVDQPLQEKKIETGEEKEKSVFSCRAKLYMLDLTNPSEGWKERGVGTLHVNTLNEESAESKQKSRIVMRADGVLKVILNLPLLPKCEVMSGMNSSLSGEKFVRVNGIEDGKPFQYALRTANAEASTKLFEQIKKLIPTEDGGEEEDKEE